MKYYWDIEELEKRQDIVLDMLDSSLDDIYSKNLLEELKLIDEMLELVKPKFFHFKSNKATFVDKKKYLSEQNLKGYLELEKEYKLLMKKAFKEIKALSFLDLNDTLSKNKIDEKDLIDMARDFYLHLPTSNNKFLDGFSEFTNIDLHNIRFGNTSSEDELGSIYMLYYPDYKPYIIIKNTATFDDFVSLVHELAHAIYSKPNRKDESVVCFGELMELEGSWFNFLACKYLEKMGKTDDYKKLKYNYLYAAYDHFLDYYLLDTIYNIFIDYSIVTKKEIINRITKDNMPIRISNYILKTTAEKSVNTSFLYFFNYLISTDLEKIYEKDPEKAFFMFDSIKTSDCSDIFELLRKHEITFMDDGFNNFNEKILTYNKNEKV